MSMQNILMLDSANTPMKTLREKLQQISLIALSTAMLLVAVLVVLSSFFMSF